MEFDEFIKDFIQKELEEIEVSFIAEIVSFDSQKMRGTIRPLLKKQSEFSDVNITDFENVPAEFLYAGGCFIRPEYQQGDLVTVTAYASTVYPAIDQGLRVNALNERFSLSNCTIRNGVAPKTITENSFSQPGLLIGKGNVYISFDATTVYVKGNLDVDTDLTVGGNISTDGDLSVTGDATIEGEATIGGIAFSTHIHSFTNANGVPSKTQGPESPPGA